jgi:hypothetical protein
VVSSICQRHCVNGCICLVRFRLICRAQ